MATESKSEFAARCNVTPGRVSQWISEGKIRPTSLDGDGRKARVIIADAMADLRRSRDVSQAVGLNGLATRITQADQSVGGVLELERPSAPAPVTRAEQPELPRGFDTTEQIAQERLRQAKIQTRRSEREEALATGRYMLTEEAEAQMARTASMVLSTVESGFNTMADALAAEFSIPRRDLLHAMTKSFRQVREAATRAFAEKEQAIARAEAEARASEDEEDEQE